MKTGPPRLKTSDWAEASMSSITMSLKAEPGASEGPWEALAGERTEPVDPVHTLLSVRGGGLEQSTRTYSTPGLEDERSLAFQGLENKEKVFEKSAC